MSANTIILNGTKINIKLKSTKKKVNKNDNNNLHTSSYLGGSFCK